PSEIAIVATADVSDFASQSSSVFASQSEPDEAPTIASSANDQITIGSDMASGTAPQGDGAPTVGVAVGEGAPTIAAPPTLIADADGIRILQPDVGGSSRPALIENIALDTITYDPDGEVLIAGRGANAGGFVRIYLDNQPITTSEISRDGDWRTDLPQVDTGIYTLRVDEVDAEGVVQSRIETPFKKEEPEEVAAILAEETSADGFDIAVKTVQPGATLWAIAEEKLGDGVLYVAVFEANRDLIRDPDLIYPGQVFRIPLTTE
ncbi:MAG: nucleoid-associated protein YgaU, partial [Yoonia sp.]